MTHVSRRKLSEETKNLLANILLASLSNANKKDLELLLKIILTKTEQVMLAKRLAIIYLLNEDQTVDNISTLLKTTPQTVQRIKLQLNLINPQAKKLLLKKIYSWANKSKIKSLLKDLYNIRVPAKQIREIK